MPIIGAFLLAFKAWMLLDAVQRCGSGCGVSSYWFIICWVPFGDWVYFFAVKIHDPEFAKLKRRLLARRQSLSDLRFAFKTSPSAANKLALARALHDNAEFEEALTLAGELLEAGPDDKTYLFLQVHCLLGLERGQEAAAALEQLTARELAFHDYDAAQMLARLYFSQGELGKAIELSRRITRSSTQLRHRSDLAFLLSQNSQGAEARRIIDEAVEEFKHEPRFIQRRNSKHFAAAKKLQKKLRDEAYREQRV